MTLSLSRMLSAVKSWKDSAQSPACSRKASPGRHLGQRLAAGCGPRRRRPAGAAPDSDLRVCSRAWRIRPVRLLVGRAGPAIVLGCPGPVHAHPAWRKARPREQSGSCPAIAVVTVTSARSWASGSGSSGAPSIPSTSATWSPRSTPRTPCSLDRVMHGGGQRPVAEGRRAGRQLGRGPPGPGRGRRRRTCRDWRPSRHRDRPGRRVLHRRHPASSCTGPTPTTSCSSSSAGTWPATLATWERHEEIQRLATLVVVNRPGPGRPSGLDDDGWRVVEVTVPNLEISSTDLRARAADGRPLDYLVPEAAVRCIRARGMYAGGG